MKRSVKILLLVVGVVGLIPVVFFGLAKTGEIYRLFNPYLDQEIVGSTTISSEWLELVPKRPLRVERQIQKIVLNVEKPVKPERDGWGLVIADGSVVMPQVQLVGDDGRIYDLNHPSSWSNPATGEIYAEFSLPELPKDRMYSQVRLRADKPVPCKRIFWRNYNQWDVS